jgi:AcrR family transcriptional regulator
VRSDQPGQQRTFIEQARREQLVQAAIGQLADAGYAGTTLAAIAARAGLSKPAVLYHFAGGKDELLDEVVATVAADATRVMTDRIVAETTWPGRLRAYIVSNLEFIDGHRLEVLALIALIHGTSPGNGGSSAYERNDERAVAELTALLRAGQQAGEFGPFRAEVVARSIRGAIDALEPVLRFQPETDLSAYGAELAGIFTKVVTP